MHDRPTDLALQTFNIRYQVIFVRNSKRTVTKDFLYGCMFTGVKGIL